MKKIIALCLALVSSLAITAQNDLTFNGDGTFKIVQFTDTHIDPSKPDKTTALKVVRETLADEKPNLVVFTGDVVTGEPAQEGWHMLLPVLEEIAIPYVILNGNHDTEQDVSYATFSKWITEGKHNLNTLQADTLTDMALTIHHKKNPEYNTALFFMDTHSNSRLPHVKGYDWLQFSQVQWFRETSAALKAHNALMFFHIPLPEYVAAFNKPSDNATGIRLEHECPADVNSGMFTAMVEAANVTGLFCGHDHDNDYLTEYMGIALAYGRFSGGKTTYIDIIPGARVITLTAGTRGFSSCLRLIDGRKIDHYTYGKTMAKKPRRSGCTWMAQVPGNRPMRLISIPGTHDTGATVQNPHLYTQNEGIEAQLQAGARAFDIRLKAIDDCRGNRLGVFHGYQFQNVTWEDDVLPAMLDFLRLYPSETLVVSLKNEGGDIADYKRLLSASLKKHNANFVDGIHSEITLDECRGRILLLHRDEVMNDYPGVMASGWDDNATCNITLTTASGTKFTASVEDEYQHRYAGKSPYKTQTTLRNMMAAASDPAKRWFISFASATSEPNVPLDFARIVNPGVAHELQDIHTPCGIVLIDFACLPDGLDLIHAILETNF